ncbi:MAG: NUDIX domain-containing protein [Rhizobiales bacterium]|nr:NUDIX domain-containing protein [Hyphomicrobiales bacterium]
MRVRKAVRLILLNENNEILLSKYEGVNIYKPGQKPLDAFWETVGGGMDEGETHEQTAMRECYEEAGLTQDDIEIGQMVWQGHSEIVYKNEHIKSHHTFMIARTKRKIDAKSIVSTGLTEDEAGYLKGFKWWSMEELQETQEHIIPPILKSELPKILNGNLPNPPLTLDLDIE